MIALFPEVKQMPHANFNANFPYQNDSFLYLDITFTFRGVQQAILKATAITASENAQFSVLIS